jgi:hypothetical protein
MAFIFFVLRLVWSGNLAVLLSVRPPLSVVYSAGGGVVGMSAVWGLVVVRGIVVVVVVVVLVVV